MFDQIFGGAEDSGDEEDKYDEDGNEIVKEEDVIEEGCDMSTDTLKLLLMRDLKCLE